MPDEIADWFGALYREIPALSDVTVGFYCSGELNLADAAGTMADDKAGTDKAVTVTGVSLGRKDAGNYVLSAQPTGVSVTISRADPAVTAPKAKTGLVSNGSAQELVEAGSVIGGTMQYAFGTDDQTAPAEGWSGEIPKAADAGTAYVWYRAAGDENHRDSEPACITVEIKAAETPDTPATPLFLLTRLSISFALMPLFMR